MTTLPDTSGRTGGCLGIRRSFVVAAVAATIVIMAPTTGRAATEPQVDVRETDGVYAVAATFTVAAPTAAAAAVLTDFERIPRFMPDVRKSVVIARDGRTTRVEQEAVAKFLFFSKKIHLQLEVQDDISTIRFRDLCGQSFHRYEGRWTLREHDGRTVIGYELSAKPAFSVPEFLLKRLLERDASRMIASLRAEIESRATRASH
jgi:ribosome-associated toxin RatA of RatAB toxin-antitoxin module